MNCPTCRSHLSDLLEKTLPEELEIETRRHLEACPDCRRELEGLRETLRLLRSAPSESPPPDLESAIIARLAAADRARRSRGSLSPPSAAIRSIARWVTAAAALTVVGLAGYTVGRDASLDDIAGGLRADLAASRTMTHSLQQEIGRLRSAAEADRERQQERVDEIFAELERARGEARLRIEEERALREEETRQLGLAMADLERLRESLESQREEIALLRSERETLRGDADRLRSELGRRDEIARAAPADGGARREEREEAAARTAPLARASSEASISVQRRGDEYEMQVAGPRDKVIPRLIALARSGEDLRLRQLAVGALENLLPPRGEPPPAEGGEGRQPAGFLASVRQTVGQLTGAGGIPLGAETEAPAPGGPEAELRRRLERVERSWRQASPQALPHRP